MIVLTIFTSVCILSADKGYKAAVDCPTAYFFKDLMRVFPDAKVKFHILDIPRILKLLLL